MMPFKSICIHYYKLIIFSTWKTCFPCSRYECTRVQSLATQHHPRLLAFYHCIIDTATGLVLTVWRIERPLTGLIARALPPWNRRRGAPKHFWGKIIDPSLRSYLRQCPVKRLRSVTGKRQRHGGRISCACYVLCIIVSLQVVRDPDKVSAEGFCSIPAYEEGWVILLH